MSGDFYSFLAVYNGVKLTYGDSWGRVVFSEGVVDHSTSLAHSFGTSQRILIRLGIPNLYRPRAWRILTGCLEFSREYPEFYNNALRNTFADEVIFVKYILRLIISYFANIL